MNLRLSCIALAFVCLALSLAAQTPNSTTAPVAATVPRLITFSGTLISASTEAGENGVVLAPGTVPTHVVAITFSLYSEQTDGAPLWSEVQNVHVDSSGRYTVQLGATQPDGLPMDIFTSAQAQWLGVQRQGQAEQPRVMVVSVPYALKAADAETFGGLPPSAYALAPPSELNLQMGNGPGGVGNGGTGHDAPHSLPITGSGTTNYVPLWTNASNLASSVIYQDPVHGYIGIGTTGPAASLDVQNNSFFPIVGSTNDGALPAITGLNLSTLGTAPGVSGSSSSGTGAGVYGSADSTSGAGAAFGVEGTTTTPNGAGVYGVVNGSNADGVAGINEATTGPATGVFGSSASASGSGVVGSASGSSGTGVLGLSTATSGQTYGVGGQTASNSNNASGVYGAANAATGKTYGVSGQSASSTGRGVYGLANSATGANYGVQGQSPSASGTGVYGTATSTTGTTYGVVGQSASPDGYGVYGVNTASGYGVYGQSDTGVGILGACVPTGSNTCFNGIAGLNTSTSGAVNGVWALTQSSDGSAVYMVNTGGGDLLFGTESDGGDATFYVQGNGSGYFGGAVQINGNLNVGGTLTKGGGSFKIDDPLDPANKYLSHSFVESPDMMNIYNGNVTTDKRGLATVVLPGYFEALNRDFRYQLTVIGQFAQAIVAKEIDHDRFTIRTNKPGVKVSWQVTGIRQDAWANAHRIPNEEDKPVQERGTYLHPEVFGASPSQGIHNAAAHRPADVSPTADAHGGN